MRNIDAVSKPAGQRGEYLFDVADAVAHAVRHSVRDICPRARRSDPVVAREPRRVGLGVDVVDARVVLGVVDVVGRGDHEAGTGDLFEGVRVVDRIVVRSVREHDHGKGSTMWIDRRVLARALGLDLPGKRGPRPGERLVPQRRAIDGLGSPGQPSLVGGVPEVDVHLPHAQDGGGGTPSLERARNLDLFDGVTDAQVVCRCAAAIGTGGVGQLPGEDERQRCREQRGERSQSADQLWVHDRSVRAVGVPGESIGVVLMWGATVG